MPDPGPPDADLWAVTVRRHRDGTWSLGDSEGGTCYAPPGPHQRRADCHTAHRYSEREALALAELVAPDVAAPALARLARIAAQEAHR